VPSWLPWTLGGVGVAGLATAGVFLALRQQKVGDLADACGETGACPSSARAIYDDGRQYTLLANVSGGVGLVALGAGAVLWFVRPKGNGAASTLAAPPLRVMVLPSGLGVSGTFLPGRRRFARARASLCVPGRGRAPFGAPGRGVRRFV
jgi:hypothetical protein